MTKLIKGFERDYDPVTHHGKVIGFVYRPISEIVYFDYRTFYPSGWRYKCGSTAETTFWHSGGADWYE